MKPLPAPTLLALLLTAATTHAAIIEDSFSGTGPANPAYWDPTGPPTKLGFPNASLDGAGNVVLATPNFNGGIVAYPSLNAAPTSPTDIVRLTVKLTSFQNSGLFGLHDFGSPANSLQLRDDEPSSTWELLAIKNGAFTLFDSGIPINNVASNTGTWVLDWTSTSVTVYLNNNPVIFATTGIPTAPLYPFAFNYSAPDAKLDSLLFQSHVPEPTTLTLLALSTTTLLPRRRPRR